MVVGDALFNSKHLALTPRLARRSVCSQVVREWHSTDIPHVKSLYTCEILDGGDGSPVFVVTEVRASGNSGVERVG